MAHNRTVQRCRVGAIHHNCFLTLYTGQWTTVIQHFEARANLARVGFNMGLDACIIVNSGTIGVSEKMMATTIEALLAAAFEDGSNEALTQVMAAFALDHEYLQAVMSISPQSRLFDSRILYPPVADLVLVSTIA